MAKANIHDEYLEVLWTMHEAGEKSFDAFRKKIESIGDEYDEEPSAVINDLLGMDLVRLDGQTIRLTENGLEKGRHLIRAHRIAERLVHDVLGRDFEEDACEFEHIVSDGLVDSICTLLGHPSTCPHGRRIPEGECCRRRDKVAHTSIVPLTELAIGESAIIAFIHAADDRQLHTLESMQIRPGIMIALHQRHPTYVVRCEGSHIAVDEEIASAIRVWSVSRVMPEETVRFARHRRDMGPRGRRRRGWRGRH